MSNVSPQWSACLVSRRGLPALRFRAKALGAVSNELLLLEPLSESGSQVRFAPACCAAQSVRGAPRRSAVHGRRGSARPEVPRSEVVRKHCSRAWVRRAVVWCVQGRESGTWPVGFGLCRSASQRTSANAREVVFSAAARPYARCPVWGLTPPSSGHPKGCAFWLPLMSNVSPQ